MSMYCEGVGCELKENCYRFTELKGLKAKGFNNGVWLTDKKECETDKDFFYVPRQKDYDIKARF